MAQINKSSEYFNTVLYTGNGSTQSITGVNFQPDFVWIKARNQAYNHFLFDIARGVQQRLKTNSTDAESTVTGLTSFDTDGFSLGSNVDMNGSGVTFTSWNWLASNTTASNTDGSITSTVSANTTSGFSIVSYTGNSTSGATIGHGLGSTPKMIIIKARDRADSWVVGHDSLGWTKFLYLNTSDSAFTFTNRWNDTAPTSSVFTLGDATNVNYTDNFIAYCFAEKKGFSKFGSYTGNGNNDGAFIYTGFKPAWVMIKRSNSAGEGWHIYDNKRNTFNLVTQILTANLSNAEATGSAGGDVIDMLSQGFKCRGTHGAINGSSNTYIYMAFAENPLVGTNNIPATAR